MKIFGTKTWLKKRMGEEAKKFPKETKKGKQRRYLFNVPIHNSFCVK
jgi:hypothetical protein